ncbi:MAG: T9SS type A sorting domain-containing protein, partial [Balneolales bacterium]|nr:T9SS type A sorting domain-containing protein [Balneolales bacterium]
TTAEYRFGAGTVVVTGMTWEYLYYYGFEAGAMQFNAIKYMLEEAGFSRYLTVNPLFGTLSPGESVEIEVLFEATDISPGKYQAEIIVESNDPAGKEVPVAVSLRVYEQGSVEIELLENWNLISSNVQPEFSETGTVIADIADNVTVMLGFDGTGLTFDPLLDSDFNTLTDVYATKGYWLRMAEPDQLTVNGYIQTPDTPLTLEEGFNLVSYLPTSPDSLTNALSSVIDNVEIVLGFEGAGLAFSTSIPNEFNTLQYLKPNLGYWIKMTAKDTLFYPNDPAVPADSIAKTSIQNIAYKSSGLVSPAREWISLWGDEVMMDSKLIPKGTVVRAIDSEGNIAGEQVFMKDGKLPLMAIYKDDPATETDEGFEPGEPITLRFGETEFEGLLDWRNNGSIQNLTKIATNLETPSVLPTEFGLDQNYPNPFNPSTIINYALPVSAEVTLEVYNMLGQKVSTILNNEPQEAAFHSVRFDASHLASGMYIYRIKAGSFVQTKKMMLIK